MIIANKDGRLLYDDRETRSLLISTGEVTVVGFDQTTMELALQFPSQQQYAQFQRDIATQMAQLGFHTMADKSLKHVVPDIATMKMKKAALTSTADVIQQNGDTNDDRIAGYQAHARELDKTIKQKEEQYEEEIRQLKAALSSEINLLAAFEHFYQAVQLNPVRFEPYEIIFLVLPYFAELYSDEVKQIVADAYKISAVKTFNIFRQILALQISKITQSGETLTIVLQDERQQGLKQFINLFVYHYPHDYFTAMMVDNFDLYATIEPTIVRRTRADDDEIDFPEFSTHLSLGINTVLNKDFQSARDAFSAASLYHISDPRPYAYKALLDLMQGDWLSALKLITHYLGAILKWDEPILNYLKQTYSFLIANGAPVIEKAQHSAINVIKLLIKLQRKPIIEGDMLTKLHAALKKYLLSPEYDLIWLELALQVVEQRLSSSMQDLLKMHMLMPVAIYQTLEHYQYDLSAWQDLIYKEKGHFLFSVVLTVSAAEQAMPQIAVDAKNFRLDKDSMLAVLAAVLNRSYNKFCLLLIRHGPKITQLLACLASLDRPLYEPLANVILEKLDSDDDKTAKQCLINWVVEHNTLWPTNLRQKLSNLIGGWLLYTPWLCHGGGNDFSVIAKRWLTQLKVDEPHLLSALEAWDYFSVKDLKNANAITKQFFVDWKAENVKLPAQTLFVVLRSFCLLSVVLAKSSLAIRFPKTYIDQHHEQMLDIALLLLARSAISEPYILPAFEYEAEVSALVWFYIGFRRQETDAAYLVRLQKLPRLLREFGDLRQAKHVKDPLLASQSEQAPTWIMQSIVNTRLLHRIDAMFDCETQRQKDRQENNRRIAAESCEYSDNSDFIKWVKQKKSLVDEFITDPAGVKSSFAQNKKLKKLPQATRERFFAECETKAGHEQAVRELEKKQGSVLAHESERLWQLVKLAAQVVTNVRSTTRQAGNYDVVVREQAEALFIMQLLYEWNRAQVADHRRDTLATAFHGPETHIWGQGPRIPHFNAGVCTEDTPEPVNVHIYYRK